MIGRCSTKTRSPANSVRVVVSSTVRSQSVCAGGQACKFERPSAEIERHTIGDGQGRRNEFHLVDELVANDPAKRLEIEFAAHRQGSRQIAVADKGRAKPVEGRVAEDVIRMLMRVDDIEDRLLGAGADGGEQPLADRHAAAGVDDGHALVADHEADIGDVAQVLFAHQGDFAGMDEHARRDFLDRQGGESLAAARALREKARVAMRAPMSQRMFQSEISQPSIAAGAEAEQRSIGPPQCATGDRRRAMRQVSSRGLLQSRSRLSTSAIIDSRNKTANSGGRTVCVRTRGSNPRWALVGRPASR